MTKLDPNTVVTKLDPNTVVTKLDPNTRASRGSTTTSLADTSSKRSLGSPWRSCLFLLRLSCAGTFLGQLRHEGFQRGAGPPGMQRVEGGDVSAREPFVIDEVAEDVAVGDEGHRILTLAACAGGQWLLELVDDLDRLALVVHSLGVARPAGHHRGG
jgi:hypothetical protein